MLRQKIYKGISCQTYSRYRVFWSMSSRHHSTAFIYGCRLSGMDARLPYPRCGGGRADACRAWTPPKKLIDQRQADESNEWQGRTRERRNLANIRRMPKRRFRYGRDCLIEENAGHLAPWPAGFRFTLPKQLSFSSCIDGQGVSGLSLHAAELTPELRGYFTPRT